MCVHAKLLQSCSIFCGAVDYSPPGSSVHGTQQERIKPTSLTSPALAGGFFTTSTTWEAQ